MKRGSFGVGVFRTCGLSAERITRIARETGFTQRSGGKLVVPDFLVASCAEAIKGTVSHNDIAATLQAETGVAVSRQACWLRLNENGQAFFHAILAVVIRAKAIPTGWVRCPFYKRILLQDSTIIQLPSRLFASFSGIRNATLTTCHARIQSIYDLCAGRFVQFNIDPYSKNDQAAAPDIPVHPGDLVLRDRGYFMPSLMIAHKDQGVDTISRYKHNAYLYDVHTQARIDLLKLLRAHGRVDMPVLAGENKSLRLRLLAVPVPEELANLRRMKAKKETKGRAPSAELLALMSWSIFITTLEFDRMDSDAILALYGLRWRIENIFKTWKSYFSFAKLHQVSAIQCRILLAARLILICICFHHAYVPLSVAIRRQTNRHLSLMKFMRYVCQNLFLLPHLIRPSLWTRSLVNAVARYCSYDKRLRSNFIDNLQGLWPQPDSIPHR